MATNWVKDGVYRSNQTSEDSLIRDITDKIENITESLHKAPFWLFLEKFKKRNRNVSNMKYEMLESDILDITTTITADATVTTDSNVAVTERALFVAGCTIFNATQKEYGRVTTAVTSTGAGNIVVTLLAGVAINHATGTAAGLWKASDVLINLGVTSTEGADDPAAVSRQLDTRYNYCEIVDTNISISDIAEMSKQYGTTNRKQYEIKCAILDHMAKLEAKLIFGVRGTSTAGGKTWWTTGGLLDPNTGIKTANVLDMSGGAFTKNTFENTFLYQIFKHGGSTKKIAFCSPGGLVLLNKLYEAAYTVNMNPGDKMVGISTRTIHHSLGQLELVPHYLMTPERYGAAYGNMIFVVDPENIGKVGFAGQGGIKHRKDRQNPNSNLYKENIRTIFGVDNFRPEVHGLIHNFAV